MALALTDTQMALVLVIGTGLRIGQQRKLLRKLNAAANRKYEAEHANDPKPSPQLSYYHRKKRGLERVTFLVDPDDAATFLRQNDIPVFDESGRGLSEAFAELIPKALYFRRYSTGED